MSTQSAQQYIKAQADFYYSQGCVNQKQEVVASPSYMPFYKNKTEEQILYEHLKEKRGPSRKYNDMVLTPSSILEKERTELLNRGQSDRSFNSMDEPSGYPREQKIIQSRDIREPIVNASSIRRDKEDYEDRDSLLNSRRIEKIEVEASPIIKQESEVISSEDNRQKKGPSLKDKLLAKKKEMETSKINVAPSSGSILKENSALPSRQDSAKVEINDEAQEPKEKAFGKKQFEIINNEKSSEELRLMQERQREEEEIPNKMDISNMTINTDIGDLARGEYARANYIEEPRSLLNRASDLSKQNKFEKNIASDREQEEPRQEGKLKRIFEQENQQYQAQNNREERQKEEEIYYKPKQEVPRNLMEDDEENESKFENRSQRGNTFEQKEVNLHQQRNSPLKQEPQRRIEEDYMTKSGVTDKQSQASKSSGQRNREEQDFDESEREPSSASQYEHLRKSKGIESKPKEPERENQYQRKDYANAEDNKMTTSYYVNQKEVQGYNEGHRVRQSESLLDKPPKSETSIVEISEKKTEKSEKAGARPVVSYLKNIEEMLMKIMAKQDALEENQRKMMQIQKRQEDQIEAIRLQLEGEE